MKSYLYFFNKTAKTFIYLLSRKHSMGLITRLRTWLTLRRAKEEEKKHVPTKKDILLEQKEFLEESKELKSMINREKQSKNI